MNNVNPATHNIGEEIDLGGENGARIVGKVVSKTEVVGEFIREEDGKCVLKTRSKVGGATAIEYVDQDFWTILVDGEPIKPGQNPQGKVAATLNDRTIRFVTSDK